MKRISTCVALLAGTLGVACASVAAQVKVWQGSVTLPTYEEGQPDPNPPFTSEEPEGAKLCSWYWDLLPSNLKAVHCAERFGFTRRRVLWRMRRGEVIENNDAMIYAIAGFELG